MNSTLTFYHYVHCPFCVRVRMVLGHFGLEYKSVVLPYDDEKTPIKLTGQKMLPIMAFGDDAINESLEIIKRLDSQNVFSHDESSNVDSLLSEIGSSVHSLAMPYWIWTPEFDQNSRKYFQTKKEVKRGPFANLVKNKETFINQLNGTLSELEKNINNYYKSEIFGLHDILIASHLWGMFVVPEFQFSPQIYEYLLRVKERTNFNYHIDFWK